LVNLSIPKRRLPKLKKYRLATRRRRAIQTNLIINETSWLFRWGCLLYESIGWLYSTSRKKKNSNTTL